MRTPPLAQARRAAKWTGTAVCILLAVAWLVSARWTVYTNNQFLDTIGLANGGVFYWWTSDSVRQTESQMMGIPPGLDWEWHAWRSREPMLWRIAYWTASPSRRRAIAVSLWAPFLLLAAPTAYLWHRDRRVPPGHCRACRYDLGGITAPVCPECGAAADSSCRASAGS